METHPRLRRIRHNHRFILSPIMLAFVLALCALPLLTSAQTVVNGQIFTYGLSIVDAPQPGT
jgi:hypothetical protein